MPLLQHQYAANEMQLYRAKQRPAGALMPVERTVLGRFCRRDDSGRWKAD